MNDTKFASESVRMPRLTAWSYKARNAGIEERSLGWMLRRDASGGGDTDSRAILGPERRCQSISMFAKRRLSSTGGRMPWNKLRVQSAVAM